MKLKGKARPTEPTPDERLEWLLRFLRSDLTALRPGERLDLGYDVARYLRDPSAIIPGPPPDPYRIALGRATPEPPDVDSAVVEVLQKTLRAGVAQLSNGLRWSPFEKKSPRWVFEPRFTEESDNTAAKNQPVARRYVADLPVVLLASAADLLVASWQDLRLCAYEPCSILFRPTEGRQRYHDPKCSALARWHRPRKRDYETEKVRRALGNGPGRGKGRKGR